MANLDLNNNSGPTAQNSSLEWRVTKLEEAVQMLKEEMSESKIEPQIRNEVKLIQRQTNVIESWIKSRFGGELNSKESHLQIPESPPSQVPESQVPAVNSDEVKRRHELDLNNAFFEGLFFLQDYEEASALSTSNRLQ